MVTDFCYRHTPNAHVKDRSVIDGKRLAEVNDKRIVKKTCRECLEWENEKRMLENKRKMLIKLAYE